jgi:uncharacterized membrane protein YvbJ
MKCSRCGFENRSGDRFCGNCGAPLEIPPPQNPSNSEILCSNCGRTNPPGSVFCESCGNRLTASACHGASTSAFGKAEEDQQQRQDSEKPVSAAWWLLPIFLTWVGGLIAFLVVKDTNKSTALKLLWTGIIITILWIAVSFIMMIISFMMNGF